MIKIIDCLVYYLALWYEEHPKQLSWSTPVERATYVVGLITICWLFALGEVLTIFFAGLDNMLTSVEIPLVILGVCSMYFYRRIYISKGRYEMLQKSKFNPFDLETKTGEILAIVFTLISPTICLALMFLV